MSEPPKPRYLPAEWQYAGYEPPFAIYKSRKLIVSMQILQPKPGFVTVHVAVSKINGSRPGSKDMDRVKAAFFCDGLAPIRENNKIVNCAETVRNLWQRVEVSVVSGDIITPELQDKIKTARGG